MDPDARLAPEILQAADRIGIRTLGVPEEFGGMQLDPASEVRTFATIAEEIARGDSGLADKLVQNWKVSVLLRNVAPRHLQERWFPRLVAAIFLHMDATVDISRLKSVNAMFPHTVGAYAGAGG